MVDSVNSKLPIEKLNAEPLRLNLSELHSVRLGTPPMLSASSTGSRFRFPGSARAALGGINSQTSLLASGTMTPRALAEYILEHGAQEIENQMEEREKDVDPFAQSSKPQLNFSYNWLISVILPVPCWLVMLLCFGFDKASESISKDSYTVMDLIRTTFNPDADQGRSIIEAILNTMSVIFGLLVTIVGIILQLSAGRFTGHVTSLFFRDVKIGLALSYAVFCNAFSFWVYLSIGRTFVPRTAVVLCVMLVMTQLIMIFPFLQYLFFFLEPDKVVSKIMKNGLKAASDGLEINGRNIEKSQVKAIMAVEHLIDAANGALKKKDKNITSEIVDALCSFSIHYGSIKGYMLMSWFRIPVWIRSSPDFLALSQEAIDRMRADKTWMEWKILRQYQMLFTEALKLMKELCYHIAMNTMIIGRDAARRGDLPTVDLCIKFFNTYLRGSINSVDVRTVYNVLFQFRLLAEIIILAGHEIGNDKPGEENALEQRALRIAKYMRYYSYLCMQKGLMFLVEVTAHDIRILCETAFQVKRMLEIFLTIDDGSGGVTEKAYDGIRKAQLMLGTYYLLEGGVKYAERIRDDFPEETHKRLWNAMHELLNVTHKELFEVSERGTNFLWLPDAQKAKLAEFVGMFKNYSPDSDPLNEAEKKMFARKQAKNNFD